MIQYTTAPMSFLKAQWSQGCLSCLKYLCDGCPESKRQKKSIEEGYTAQGEKQQHELVNSALRKGHFVYPVRWMRWDCSILPPQMGRVMVYLRKGSVGEVVSTEMTACPPSGESARLRETVSFPALPPRQSLQRRSSSPAYERPIGNQWLHP